MQTQKSYWDHAATTRRFSHPLNEAWLARWFQPAYRILDYGCGYGRTLVDLARLGFANGVGVDVSPQMIERGRRENPRLDLRAIEGLPLAEMDRSFDAVLLFAVLTCIPSSDDQAELIAELHRLLRPGGLLYVSDMPLQADPRNLERYAAGEAQFGTRGVFATEDGAVMRHHPPPHFDALLRDFKPLLTRSFPLTTMNGNRATGLQSLVRRPPDA